MSPQFKNKAEARAAIADMENRMARCTDEALRYRWEEYRAEAARITALLPTLPE